MAKQLQDDVRGAGKERYVQTLFNSIARYYDLMNLVMTGGMVKLWHRAFAGVTGLRPGGRALDVACGTADLTLVCARQVGPTGKVIGVDFAADMLAIGRRKVAAAGFDSSVELRQGDAMALPFPDDRFDCASIGFALRNVADIAQTLREMTRVVRPGGRVVSLEISRPQNRWFRPLFLFYFYRVVPVIDRVLSALGPQARAGVAVVRPYTYLPHSLTHFPDQDRLAAMFEQAGLTGVYYRPLSGGVVTLHVGTKPGQNAGAQPGWPETRSEGVK